MLNYKRNIFAIAISLTSVLLISTRALAASNLVAYWAFDETSGTVVYDSSGNNQTATNFNATISTDVPNTNFTNVRSLLFNGTNSYVSAPAQATLTGNSSRSISLWFKTNVTTQDQGLFDSGGINVNNTAQEIYTVAANGANPANPPATSPGGIAIVMWGNDIYVPIGINNVANNEWHQLVFTYDNTTQQATLYFDGTAESSYLWNGSSWTALVSQPFTLSSPLNTTANNVFIGHTRTGYFSSGNNWFTGNIDDVSIYDIALTSAGVSNLAAGSNNPNTPVTPTNNPTNVTTPKAIKANSTAPDTGYGKPIKNYNLTFIISSFFLFIGLSLLMINKRSFQSQKQ